MIKLIRSYPLLFVALALLLVIYFSANIASFYTDWLWFGEVGYRKTFVRIYGARILLFAVFGATSFVLAYLNVWLARRFSPPVGVKTAGSEVYASTLGKPIGRTVRVLGGLRSVLDALLLLGALLFAVLAGLWAQAEWDSFLRFLHPIRWGIRDPEFGRDLGLYIFTLPFLRFVQGWLLVVLLLVGGGVLLVYLYQQGINAASGRTEIALHVRAHLSVIATLVLLVKAWSYYLDRYDLLYGWGSVAPGAGYTDIHARLPMLDLLVGVTFLTAVAAAINIRRRNIALAVVGTGLWLAFAGAGVVIPGIVQRVSVKPNEAEREAPYIANAVVATRDAWGVSKMRIESFAAMASPLTTADLARNRNTLDNIRLWDYEPLLETYPQQQGLRQYYSFPDVDVDRYRLNGPTATAQQVLLAAREIAPERMEDRAQSWQNTHMRYTHGFGAVVSPAGRVTAEGLPEYLLHDIPPVTANPALRLTQPRIYYGISAEQGSYAVVGGRHDEFDYPTDESAQGHDTEDRSYRYQGRGGVRLTPLAKLAFAIRFNGWTNLLLTNDLTPQSRLLFARRVSERVKRVAPFLLLDHDPYPVIVDGRIVWIQDCYTTSSSYPNAQFVDWSDDLSRPIRLTYLRNAVKAVVDAYDGSVTLYASDEQDPILRCYQQIFPGLIRAAWEMPSVLREHRRYPEDLFTLQRRILCDYHVIDPQVFYARADVWQLARRQATVEAPAFTPGQVAISSDESEAMAPYFVTLRLPGETGEEFSLLSAFTPRDRQNMIALMAARCDGDRYGELVLYRFPASRTVYGPEQIGKRLRSDSRISPFLSLNDQRGSHVLFGSMLIVPIEKSLLYVQPIYVRAQPGASSTPTDSDSENSSIPELKQVVAAWEGRIAMEPTLSAALTDLLTDSDNSTSISTAGTPPSPPTADMASLVRTAGEQYDRAQARLRAGDFAGYGREAQALGETLKRLRARTGGDTKALKR